MRGMFISVEGVEGAGKSTQCRRLAESLRARGLDVVLTREPDGTPIGAAIRSLFTADAPTPTPLTQVLLFMAARQQHVAEVIRPALSRGAVVLSDRYADATMAYQGFGQGVDLETIRDLNALATGGRRPQAHRARLRQGARRAGGRDAGRARRARRASRRQADPTHATRGQPEGAAAAQDRERPRPRAARRAPPGGGRPEGLHRGRGRPDDGGDAAGLPEDARGAARSDRHHLDPLPASRPPRPSALPLPAPPVPAPAGGGHGGAPAGWTRRDAAPGAERADRDPAQGSRRHPRGRRRRGARPAGGRDPGRSVLAPVPRPPLRSRRRRRPA